MSSPSVAFLTLGCRVNQAEEATYQQHSLENGWRLVPFKQSADIYVFNTCAVTLEAERQSRQMIRQARKRNPDSKIVVTGCAGRSLQSHPEIAEVADLFVPNLTKDNLVSQLRSFLGETEHPQFKYAFPPVEQSRTTRLNLKITDGCFESCAFCIIPARRGTVRSLPTDTVIQRINEADELGYKEVILTGVHLGAYGHEHGEHGLDQLLERINAETSIPHVRLSSIDPHEVTERMIQALADSPRICPYLHLPIQSGSDTVLERMRRRDTREGILNTMNALKTAIPDISLTTDMILGFPGESNEDFELSYSLMQEIGINKIHVFPFSVRPGTRAAFMKDKVPADVKQARVQKMLAYSLELRKAWFESWLNQEASFLTERVNQDGVARGYTPHYIKVHVPEAEHLGRNELHKIKLVDYDLEQEIMLAQLL